MSSNIFDKKNAMRKIIAFLFLSAVFVLSFAQPAKWTVMVYLDADNDLEDFGIIDLNEMELAGSTTDVKIVVQIDRNPDYDNSNGNWTNTRRYLVTKDTDSTKINSTLLQQLGEQNMGHPNTLLSFINYAKTNYPANHYALIIWNHGAGWRSSRKITKPYKDICWDETNNNDSLSSFEIDSALSVSSTHFDIIGYDACLMGMIENAYQLRNHCDYMIGSEETEPGDGYQYTTLLNDLIAHPDMTSRVLAGKMVYYYAESHNYNDITQAAIDLSKIRNVATKLDALASAIMSNNLYDEVAAIFSEIEYYSESSSKDLWHFAHLMSISTSFSAVEAAAENLKTAVTQAVVLSLCDTNMFRYSHGLAIYLPDPLMYDDGYSDGSYRIEFPDSSLWGGFLSNFAQKVILDNTEPNDYFATATYLDIYDAAIQDGYFTQPFDQFDVYKVYNSIDDAGLSIDLSVPADYDLYLLRVHDSIIDTLAFSWESGSNPEYISIYHLIPGWYHIVVVPYNNDTSSQPYTLEIDGTADDLWDDTATTLAYGLDKAMNYFSSNSANSGAGMVFTNPKPDMQTQIKKVWLYFPTLKADGSGNGRFQLYLFDHAGQPLLPDSVRFFTPLHTGWMGIDLTADNLYVQDNFFVGLYWDGVNTPGIGFDMLKSYGNAMVYQEEEGVFDWYPVDSMVFLIRAELDHNEPAPYCNSLTTLTSATGTISDGSNSAYYASNTLCNWKIEVPGASSIELRFTSFLTEEDYDFVTVFDGPDTNADILGEFSGVYSGRNLPVVTSTGNSMFIEFSSDEYLTDEGWEAVYTIPVLFPPVAGDNELQYLLYPNPASDVVRITGQGNAVIHLGLLSADGTRVYETFAGLNEDIDISGLPAGFYLARITSGMHVVTCKLIVR